MQDVWVVISLWKDDSEYDGQVHDVIGPFASEQDAMDYIPNPTPRGFAFIVQALCEPTTEFAL